MVNNDQQNPMGIEKEQKLLFTMALPIVVSMLVQAIYNIIDSAFVGFLSEDALSAVSMVFPFQTLFTALNVGIGVGISQNISLCRGTGEISRARRTAGQGLLLALICTLAFSVFGLFFSGSFFSLSNVYGDIADIGKTYLTIVTVFSTGIFCESAFERMLMSTGHTKQSMICQVTGAVINIILDPILIFGIGVTPPLGVAGAAIATVFSQHVAAILAFCFHKKWNQDIYFSFSDIKPHKKTLADICGIGVSAAVKQGAASIVLMIVNALLFHFSSTATAVYGAFNRLYVFFLTPSWAIQDVLVILVAYNLGIGNKNRYTKIFKLSLIWGLVITIAGCIFIAAFPETFLLIFGAKETMLELGKTAFAILVCFLPFQTIASTISSMLQGLGAGMIALLAGLIERFVLPLGFVYLFSMSGNLNLVWWAFTFAEIIGVILSAVFLKYVYNNKICPKKKQCN